MKIGGTRVLTIPPGMGYGRERRRRRHSAQRDAGLRYRAPRGEVAIRSSTSTRGARVRPVPQPSAGISASAAAATGSISRTRSSSRANVRGFTICCARRSGAARRTSSRSSGWRLTTRDGPGASGTRRPSCSASPPIADAHHRPLRRRAPRAVVPIVECPVHAERANRIAFALHAHLARKRIPAAGPALARRAAASHCAHHARRARGGGDAGRHAQREGAAHADPRVSRRAASGRPACCLNIHDTPGPYMVGPRDDSPRRPQPRARADRRRLVSRLADGVLSDQRRDRGDARRSRAEPRAAGSRARASPICMQGVACSRCRSPRAAITSRPSTRTRRRSRTGKRTLRIEHARGACAIHPRAGRRRALANLAASRSTSSCSIRRVRAARLR